MTVVDEGEGGLEGGGGWDMGWEAHARAQRRAWQTTTPAQRLAWLEEAIEFARRHGALGSGDALRALGSAEALRGSPIAFTGGRNYGPGAVASLGGKESGT